MKIIVHWIIAAVAIGVAAYIVPGVTITPIAALVAAVVLGALNFLIRPILVVLTMPINILTLGILTLVINAGLVLLASAAVPGFAIASFSSALLFALALAIINWVFHLWNHH
ncbi:phage holin family protein [Candidatus Kaiserbacteria bacterium]|nr:phage holin family protein [Candidatus Kaiserbacteria bacterium]